MHSVDSWELKNERKKKVENLNLKNCAAKSISCSIEMEFKNSASLNFGVYRYNYGEVEWKLMVDRFANSCRIVARTVRYVDSLDHASYSYLKVLFCTICLEQCRYGQDEERIC